jgi:hypothetical protein
MITKVKGKSLSLLALPGVCFIALAGCGDRSGPTVAVINGQPITQAEYHSYLERMQLVQVQTDAGVQQARIAGTLGLQALNDLVRRELVLQLAKEEGLLPNEADIEQELAFQTKRRPDFVSFLTGKGMTLEMIRNDIRFDLARERLLTRGKETTMDEVEQFIQENPQMLMEQPQAQLLWVVVSSEDKKAEVDKSLAAGQSFQVVATKFSEAPRAREMGGMYQETRVQSMPKGLQQLVAQTPEMRSSVWVQDGKNHVKFYVQRKTEPKPIVMDDVKKEYLRRQMALQKADKDNNLTERLRSAFAGANINVTASHLKGPWDSAFEELKAEFGSQASSMVGSR